MRSLARDIDRFARGLGAPHWRIALTLLGLKVPLHFTARDGSRHTCTVAHRKDLRAIEMTFVDLEYEWKQGLNPRVIFDLGAYIGDTAMFFHHEYPDARVFAFEPHPELFELLVRNTKRVENISCHRLAVAGSPGQRTLHCGGGRLGASLRRRSAQPQRVPVAALTLRGAMERVGVDHIDLLKFDIEGLEDEVFEAPFVDCVSNVIGEVHEELLGVPTSSFISRFQSYNTTVTRMANHRLLLKAARDPQASSASL